MGDIKIKDIYSKSSLDELDNRVTILEDGYIDHAHTGSETPTIRSTMLSHNYKEGESGWLLNDNGSVEFIDFTVAGLVKTISVTNKHGEIQNAIDFLNKMVVGLFN